MTATQWDGDLHFEFQNKYARMSSVPLFRKEGLGGDFINKSF